MNGPNFNVHLFYNKLLLLLADCCQYFKEFILFYILFFCIFYFALKNLKDKVIAKLSYLTRVARYISDLIMKLRIFIIKNDFIVFQSIRQHALKPLVKALFPLRLRHFQNMVFERFNSIFWRRKSLSTHFFLDVRE